MSRQLAIAILAFFVLTGAARACLPDTSGPAPSMDDEPVVFVGTVTAIEGEEFRQTVVFAVDYAERGVEGATVRIPQGVPGMCSQIFDLGQRYLFAGTFIISATKEIAADAVAEEVIAKAKVTPLPWPRRVIADPGAERKTGLFR